MKTNYLKYIVEEIHTTVVATVDDVGHPVTAAIDMMDYDDRSLYFLTAKGKNFYDRLKKERISGPDRHERRRYHVKRGGFPGRKSKRAWDRASSTLIWEKSIYE